MNKIKIESETNWNASGKWIILLKRFSPLFLAMWLATGCATNGRYVLLKEYGPSVPQLAINR